MKSIRPILAVLICFATFSPLWAVDAAPATPRVLMFVKYEMLNGGYSLTFTGTDTLLYAGRGELYSGHYLTRPADGKIVITLDEPQPPAAANLPMFTPVGDGMLYGGRELMLAVATNKDKAKALLPNLDRLARAEAIGSACIHYASDHDGLFPAQLADLLPKYAPRGDLFTGLAPEQAIMGYSYMGSGFRTSDPGAQIILMANAPTSDGRNIVVLLNGNGKIQPAKP